nr:hypothetical protein [Tanacetum cinerariifolium]
MFETGTYKSLPEHVALYEAVEASMERANRDEYLTEKDNFSKKQSDPHAEQPVEDIPMPDTAIISNSKDTDSSHLSKIKQRPEWLKPILDDERLATLEPGWVIPTSHIPDSVNNWANALATTYQASAEKSLLEKTRDLRTFMHWYCQQMGKTELTQADLEGQAYEFIKAFFPDVIHLQIQMEEFKKMLTDQIDSANPEGDQVRIDISKPLPLSGPPVHIKAARYLDFGLKLLVPEHLWINKSYQKQLNLTKPGWDTKGFEYKHDYIIINSPCAVVFPVGTNEKKIMRFNEIYKFINGMLTNIIKALDYRVKEYKVNRLNLGMNTWFWTDKDVARSKEFIHAIEQRLKTRRIFQNLECFVGYSNEVSISTEGVEELKRNVRIKGEKKEALHILRA